MKTFLVTIILYAAVTHQVCHADPSAPVSTNAGKQMEGKPPGEKNDDRGKSGQNETQTKAGTLKSNTRSTSRLQKRPGEAAANHNPAGNIINPHPPAGPNNVAGTGPSKMNINRPPPAGSTSAVPGSSLNNSRNRNSGLTAIGGAANAKYGITATINGTGMHHKP